MTRDEKIVAAANEILSALSRMEKSNALTAHQRDCSIQAANEAFKIKKELLV